MPEPFRIRIRFLLNAWDYLLLYVITLLAAFFLNKEHSSFFVIVLILTVLFFLIAVIFHWKRRKELDEIKAAIKGISEKKINTPADVALSPLLDGLEEEIRSMLSRQQHDIDYLEKLEKMRTEFLGNVSHELKTPIFAVQGFIETLLNGALQDPKVNRVFLEKANLHAGNLSALVNDLIDISMIETGEMRMSFRYFPINPYLAEIVNEFIPMALSSGLNLEFLPAPTEIELFGDKVKLRQVITNLIHNAFKYSEKGTVTVSVQDWVKFGRISVKDTGIGIAQDDIPRLFERFFRVDKARSRAVGGTGLGLAIVKHIIEAHGSRVEVFSELGKGSEFSFLLKK